LRVAGYSNSSNLGNFRMEVSEQQDTAATTAV
jgi:hypothetical protein